MALWKVLSTSSLAVQVSLTWLQIAMSRSAALIIVHMATPFVSRRKSTSPSFYTLCSSVSAENLEHVDHNGFTISTEDGSSATFISDLADAVIESLPYVGAMAVSNLEAQQVRLWTFIFKTWN
ncbi:hypothetical protein LOK49_LG12G01409 [Camellia lanceoleosa]|uniref:Uncharacterized protein n=1 Tax=Camellia lanceoleosa TaxID=1840588 RepID=A0ACC0FSK8_9ERIC|nr:hypothetical protein LOK49_LG12G01409 [Camellia lanceoleosa]